MRLQKYGFIIKFFITNIKFSINVLSEGVDVMSKVKKIISLTVLISVLMFPSSAFASSNHSTSDNKKNFFSNVVSFFTFKGDDSYQSDKYTIDKDWDKKGWIDWFEDKDDWWEDICWWEDNKTDSFKMWERYYCY